ncbi:MAG TPA: glutathione S-transferase N-terminal domain-containing protein [Reyranella sp.]|nr:glutathione S-transferase N-terminal domain-containing protein [Reyranella sp.]
MALVMYERVGLGEHRISPFSWRIRFAMAHKKADVEYIPTRFSDVAKIERLSSQKFVPIIVDGTKVIADSWNIARHLEAIYPDRPSLFGDEASLATTRFINLWAESTLMRTARMMWGADFLKVLDPEGTAYFRSSREPVYGMTLEAAQAKRAETLPQFVDACLPLERLLGEQAFVSGTTPRYADYIVFSVFQWARMATRFEIVTAGSQIARWRSTMIGLYDGLADKFPGPPA